MGLSIELIQNTEDAAVLHAALCLAALGDRATGDVVIQPDDSGKYYIITIPIRGETMDDLSAAIEIVMSEPADKAALRELLS